MSTDRAYEPEKCDWCDCDLGSRIFHFEGKRYCSWACMGRGAPHEMSKPLFETKPFPPALHRLRAQVSQL